MANRLRPLSDNVAVLCCAAAEAGKNHCPQCHSNIKASEDGWKEHLMGKDGCRQNPRRLPFLSKCVCGGGGGGRGERCRWKYGCHQNLRCLPSSVGTQVCVCWWVGVWNIEKVNKAFDPCLGVIKEDQRDFNTCFACYLQVKAEEEGEVLVKGEEVRTKQELQARGPSAE